MNEQLLKTSGADVLSSRKKLWKTLLGGGNPAPLPPLFVRPRVIKVNRNVYKSTGKSASIHTNQILLYGNRLELSQ